MTTQDDIIVGGSVTGGVAAPARLGKGTDGQVLTVDPTTHHLLWATPSGGGSDLVQVASGAGSVVIPGLKGSADAVPASPSAYDDEFNTTDTTDPIGGWTTLGTSFDALNSNSDAASHLHMKKIAPGTFQVYGIYKTAPSVPYTVTCKVTDYQKLGGYAQAGLMITETSPGKLFVFGPCSSSGLDWVAGAWASRTSRSSAIESRPGLGWVQYMRMIITSGTNVTCQVSDNGLVWHTIHSSLNSGLTPANVGLFITGQDGNVLCEGFFDWIRFS